MTDRLKYCAWLSAFLTFSIATGCGPAETQLSDATQHVLAADEALEAGDNDKALSELTAAIELDPDVWTYYRRAELNLRLGNDDAALSDCDAGLALDDDHEQLIWLKKEAKKPPNRRFQGSDKEAPSSK